MSHFNFTSTPSIIETTTTTTILSTPGGRLSPPPSTPLSSIASSLFPGVEVADHFLPDEDDYANDFIANNNHNGHDGSPSDVSSQYPLANLSSSTLLCTLANTSLALPSSCTGGALTKTKIYTPDDLWAENEIFARKLAPAMVFIALLMMIGILGNALVVYVYGFRFKTATQHFLIVCLACFDLVMCTIAMPAEIADIRFHHTFTSVFACKSLRFVTMFASISSSFTLVTVAYDRHRRITRPLSRQISMQQARIWMLSNMIAALSFSWPTLVLTGIRSSETRISGLTGTDCSFSERFKKTKYPLAYNAVLGLGFFTMITVIAIFYFRIWKTAKTRKINMAKRYTIGSFSDQFMSEMKLHKNIQRDRIDDILSKQLEKCVRHKLQSTPSIDCKDIYYFFENNSIRSTIGSGIARRRGRYKGFSVSSSGEPSTNSNTDDCVLGQSFSYRTSVNSRCRDKNPENHDETHEDSKMCRRVGKRISNLSKSFSMAKIPEHSSCYKMERLEVHIDTTNISSKKGDKDDQSSMELLNNPNRNTGEADIDSNSCQDCQLTGHQMHPYGKYQQYNVKDPCHRTNSNSPFLDRHTTTKTSSPSLSLKSLNSTNSPGRFRRNSSPLITQRRGVKSKLDQSISVISDEFRPRPMSSLVDSVSKTLGRLQQFSGFGNASKNNDGVNNTGINKDYEIYRDLNTSRIHHKKSVMDKGICIDRAIGQEHSKSVVIDNKTHQANCIVYDNDDDETTFSEYPFDSIQHNSSFVFDSEYEDVHCENLKQEMDENLVDNQNTQQLIFTESGISSKDHSNATVFNNESTLECISHLIGPRSKPMEIPHLADGAISTGDDRHHIIEIETTDILPVTDITNSCNLHTRVNPNNHEHSETTLDDGVKQANAITVTDPTKSQNNCHNSNDSILSQNKVCSTAASDCTTSPTANNRVDTIDMSDVQTRQKPRSFSNSSLDAVSLTNPRRPTKNGCVCLPQNLDKTTVVAFTVSFVFILSFLPFLILMFIRGLVKDFDYSLDGATLCIYHIFLRFYFLNSAINPFLYGLLNVNFRYECVRTWERFVSCLHGNEMTRNKKDAIC